MKGDECVMDAVMSEPPGTWKTSPRQIRVQTLKARSDCTPAGRCRWRSVTSQASPPRRGKCCRMSPWLLAWCQEWLEGKSLPAREANSPVNAAPRSGGDTACPWGSRESLRELCVVFCVGHQFAIIQLCSCIMQRQGVLASQVVSVALLSTPPLFNTQMWVMEKNFTLLLHNKILNGETESKVPPPPRAKQ